MTRDHVPRTLVAYRSSTDAVEGKPPPPRLNGLSQSQRDAADRQRSLADNSVSTRASTLFWMVFDGKVNVSPGSAAGAEKMVLG